MAQDTGLESELSIWDEMLTVFDDLFHQEQAIRKTRRKDGTARNVFQ